MKGVPEVIQWINLALNARRPGLFGMPWRQATGFVESLLRVAGLDWRVARYGLRVSDSAQTYVQTHLNDAAFRRWRAMVVVNRPVLLWYRRDFTQAAWPGHSVIPAQQVETGPIVNDACPYSGQMTTHFMEINDQIWGFCNAFRRDKTMADPCAWPAFAALSGIVTAPTV